MTTGKSLSFLVPQISYLSDVDLECLPKATCWKFGRQPLVFGEVAEASGGRARCKEGFEAVPMERLFCHVLRPSCIVPPQPPKKQGPKTIMHWGLRHGEPRPLFFYMQLIILGVWLQYQKGHKPAWLQLRSSVRVKGSQRPWHPPSTNSSSCLAFVRKSELSVVPQ